MEALLEAPAAKEENSREPVIDAVLHLVEKIHGQASLLWNTTTSHSGVSSGAGSSESDSWSASAAAQDIREPTRQDSAV